MEGKITEYGILYVERGNPRKGLKRQECPFISSAEPGTGCGDWCPLFGEPELKYVDHYGTPKTVVHVCKAKLVFKQFTDERKQEQDKTSSETAENNLLANAEVKAENESTVSGKHKRKPGRPRKKRPTDEEILSSVETSTEPPVATDPVEEEVIYHEPCKTCRKSRRNADGEYPACDSPMFETGPSGIETCALWWERR